MASSKHIVPGVEKRYLAYFETLDEKEEENDRHLVSILASDFWGAREILKAYAKGEYTSPVVAVYLARDCPEAIPEVS